MLIINDRNVGMESITRYTTVRMRLSTPWRTSLILISLTIWLWVDCGLTWAFPSPRINSCPSESKMKPPFFRAPSISLKPISDPFWLSIQSHWVSPIACDHLRKPLLIPIDLQLIYVAPSPTLIPRRTGSSSEWKRSIYQSNSIQSIEAFPVSKLRILFQFRFILFFIFFQSCFWFVLFIYLYICCFFAFWGIARLRCAWSTIKWCFWKGRSSIRKVSSNDLTWST